MNPSVNVGLPFDPELLCDTNICKTAISHRADSIKKRSIREQTDWLIRCIQCIDLTTLSGDDTPCGVEALSVRALEPTDNIKCAALCIYPARVEDVKCEVRVAAVATGFPSGQYGIESRLEEIKYAVNKGAQEIDIVINRSLALQGQWEELYEELRKMKNACTEKVHMKAILAVGELGSLENVYKASMAAMMAGSDFIKTSTGKENVNAELIGGLVMARAIRHYWHKTGTKVGLKPAGGIRNTKQAIEWLIMVKEELGDEWLHPDLFRIGASGLLDDVLRRFEQLKV